MEVDFKDLLHRAEQLMERQRHARQYQERVAAVRRQFEKLHVSPVIQDRVLRLNPTLEEGAALRGIHYKSFRDPRPMHDVVGRGECIRRFGRSWVEGLAPTQILKRGRRKYVTRMALLTTPPPANPSLKGA